MRSRALPAAALVIVLLAVGCRPDPTSGRPPGPRAEVPRFRAPATTVSRADLGSSWRPGCPVHFTALRAMRISYWSYAGTYREGTLIVHRHAAVDVREVFRRLYDRRFQIRQIIPVDHFGSSDDRSMRANNTSAFNCRRVAGTSTWSQHAYGRAIDINPVQNPYVVGGRADPPSGQPWVDRRGGGPGMAMPHNVVTQAFAEQGWGWGGRWTSGQGLPALLRQRPLTQTRRRGCRLAAPP